MTRMKPAVTPAILALALLWGACDLPPGEDMEQYYFDPGNPRTRASQPRPVESRPTLLSNVGELNMGRTAILPDNGGAVIGEGELIRLLDVQAPSGKDAIVATIAMSVFVADGRIDTTRYPPFLGIIEFGQGGSVQRIEFDLPGPNIQGANLRSDPPLSSFDNGIAISVPGSSFRAFARNNQDAESVLGGFGITPAPLEPVTYEGRAHIVPFPVGTNSLLKRSAYITGALQSMGAAVTATLAVPPYAKRLRVFREPFTATLDVVLSVPNGTATISIPASDLGEIPLPSGLKNIDITNTSAGAIDSVVAQFDVGF